MSMQAVVLRATWDPRADYPLTPAEQATQKATQASGVWRNPKFELKQQPEPSPAHGEVVVEVGACGICGSDTHCYETDAEGWVQFSGPARLPVIVGHEYAGRVVACGEGVRDIRVGQLVAAEGMLYCGVCEACRRGHVNQCPRLEMTGFSAPGAYAQQVAVHERHLWSLDALAERLGSAREAISWGALIEPLACSYNGIWVSAGGMLPGSHVAVYGCGPIGLGAILLCRAAGAATVLAFDRIPERVELARRCGAEAFLVDDCSPSELVRQRTHGWGADLQVEAAGAAAGEI